MSNRKKYFYLSFTLWTVWFIVRLGKGGNLPTMNEVSFALFVSGLAAWANEKEEDNG